MTGTIGKSFFDQTDPLMPENEETYAEYRETSGNTIEVTLQGSH